MNKKKKVYVLYIITKLELGGAQKVCLSLVKGLQDKGNFSGLISGNDGLLVSKAKKIGSFFSIRNFNREIGFSNVFNEIKTFF